MPVAIRDLLFTAPVAGQYIEPMCVADLSEGSDAQFALEFALFPTGYKQVQWFPIIGIATNSVADAPEEAVLWELLFSFLPFIPSVNPVASFTLTINPVNPTNSDLIVPMLSQRNATAPSGHPNSLAGESFSFTTHVHISAAFVGETKRHEIALKVGDLLSRPPSYFNPNWSLGP